MENWIEVTNELLKYKKKKVVENSENIAQRQAIEKAND